jgi:PAS domain-containing protein
MSSAIPPEHSAESLLRALMRNVPGAIYRGGFDDDWSMVVIGDEVERITGYPTADFVGGRRTFNSVIHPDDREYVNREVHEAVARELPFSLEYRVVRAGSSSATSTTGRSSGWSRR